jgi:integrase
VLRMARGLNRLTARAVTTIKEPGLHADGGGLYIRVTPTGSRAWTFIYRFGGKRRETGFGPLAAVSLADAREKAARARAAIADGHDPKIDPNAGTPGADATTFGEAADDLVATLEKGWKNPKHRQQWRNTLKSHCAPIWAKSVAAIDTADVASVLSPIWSTTPETATRLRGRIERVLDAAKVKGQRSGENPARWRGHLEIILPKRRKKSLQRHHPAMPYADVGDFVRSLKLRVSTAARALEFLILTAARTNEVLGMKWKEVDLDAALWTVPAERMKMEVGHRVPLTEPALTVLRAMAVFGTDPEAFVFPSRKPGAKLSDMSMEMLLRRMDEDEFTVHGFRSSFRDWAGEETDFPREVAEAALAHQVGDEVERAYRRGDALAKRRALMEEWAGYLLADRAT